MRIKDIILNELINDRLITYETLEKDMNDTDLDIKVKVEEIKKSLKLVMELNNMIKLWEEILEKDIVKTIEKDGTSVG